MFHKVPRELCGVYVDGDMGAIVILSLDILNYLIYSRFSAVKTLVSWENERKISNPSGGDGLKLIGKNPGEFPKAFFVVVPDVHCDDAGEWRVVECAPFGQENKTVSAVGKSLENGMPELSGLDHQKAAVAP